MKLLSRVALLLSALAYLISLGISLAGQWMLDAPTPENLERGIQWDSRNPALWARYARQWHFLASSPESQRAVEGYQKAASLNPLDPSNWKELASAQMERQDLDGAEVALRGELAAVPHSPQASWRMANLLLVRGRTAEAYPYLRIASNERSLRVPVFDLARRLEEDPEVIRRDLVPQTPEARADYLQFLVSREILDEAYPVWQEVARNGSPETIRLGNSYVDALVRAGKGSDAARVWDELLAITGQKPRPEGELLTNGDFENQFLNAGLDWRLTPSAGYQIALDAFLFQNGTRSLRVTFDGTVNPNFEGISQTIPVDPNRRYRFQAYLRADGITSDNGPFFRIGSRGAPPEETFTVTTPQRVQTMGWVREQLDFQTGPRTSLVIIQLRRLPSQKLNNLVQGKVWIDNLSVKPLS